MRLLLIFREGRFPTVCVYLSLSPYDTYRYYGYYTCCVLVSLLVEQRYVTQHSSFVPRLILQVIIAWERGKHNTSLPGVSNCLYSAYTQVCCEACLQSVCIDHESLLMNDWTGSKHTDLMTLCALLLSKPLRSHTPPTTTTTLLINLLTHK